MKTRLLKKLRGAAKRNIIVFRQRPANTDEYVYGIALNGELKEAIVDYSGRVFEIVCGVLYPRVERGYICGEIQKLRVK